ncbi:hypothetical protein B0J14DRAFT_597616 [Halenospora varia]|nr:hypothetical protein B0J14DRAFT_597616 [Halenospora varia]
MSFWTSPVLELSGILSQASVSQSQPLHSSIVLSLSVCLRNPEGPITILKKGSFLDAHSYGRDSCPFILRSVRTGRLAPFSVLHVNFGGQGGPHTVNTDNDLLTLYHEMPVTVHVTVGMNDSTNFSVEQSFLCTTNIKELVVGETYCVDWEPDGLWTTVINWWTRGSKESVVEKYIPWWKYMFGVRTFYTEPTSSCFGDKGLRFQMIESPKVLVTK